MIEDAIVNEIMSINDFESGGDNALDGFEFQVSSAIYLVFEELSKKNEFKLAYEKLEDFIIFTDEINLYQAKSINQNLTPNVLFKVEKKGNGKEHCSSIIEKMYNNYLAIKEKTPNCSTFNTLIICESRKFSKRLSKVDKFDKLEKINFRDLNDDAKQSIISNTSHNQYNWGDIKARRLIPKSRHEEVTRAYIEDVINIVIGENKIKTWAIYNSISNEIRKIRKNKSLLSNDFILEEINKYSTFDDSFEFRDYVYLLNNDDQKNIPLKLSFDINKNCIKINNHPAKKDYDLIVNVIKKREINSIDDAFNKLKMNPDFKEVFIRLADHDIKALILIGIIEEIN